MSNIMPAASMPPLPLADCTNVETAYLQPVASELTIHLLHAGQRGNPLIVILHGFPEIAFSWRKVAGKLAHEGFFVVVPDTRGNGRTSGWDDGGYDSTDLRTFSASTLMQDVIVLIRELGYSEVHCIVGHDVGARTASMCALARPDIFRRVALVAQPYGGPPKVKSAERPLLPDARSRDNAQAKEDPDPVLASLAALSPPRKPYKWYFASPQAANDMLDPLSELKPFLRGYFYLKSASWPGNDPRPLEEWSAPELAKMPFYYTMPLHSGMRQSVRLELERSKCSPESSESWLSDEELDVYAMSFAHTGFQGALNWYRVLTSSLLQRDLTLFADMRMQPPCLMILGEKDWGAYQVPNSLDNMPKVCDQFKGIVWIKQAGHFPHMEQPEAVAEALIKLCKGST